MKHRFLPQGSPLRMASGWGSFVALCCLVFASTSLNAQSHCTLSPNISTVSATCFGGDNGSATLDPSGGVAPYAISWATGSNSNSISGLSAGNYAFTITDVNGCSTNGNVYVGQAAPLIANVSRTNNACHFDTNGSLSLSPLGGTAPYSYEWSTGATSASIVGLAAGQYGYTITDANGCNRSGSVSVLTNTPIVANPTVRDNNCYDEAEGSAFLTPTGGVAPYTYEWSTGATTANVTGLAAGTYGYTITDSEGCTATGDFAVQEPAPVWTTFTQQYACGETANNGSAEVFANGGTPPYSYQWSNGATTAAINNLAPGMYGYTVTDALGCESASGLVCIFRSINTSTASSTNTSCAGDASGTATITVTQGLPPYTYAWSNGETTATITGLAAGMYAYTVTGQGGCSSSGAVIVNNGTDTEINLDVVNNANGSLTATASNGAAPYTYEWNNGETGPTATMYGAGSSYSVTATDADGCTATAAGITTGNTDPCAGINIGVDVDQSATGNLVPSISGNGTAPYTYEWSNGETTAIATGYAGGQSYTLTVTDANGCTATVSGTVETSSCPANITFPGTIAADQTLCAPGVVPDQLVEIAPASGGMGPIEYLWMSSTVTSDFSNAFFTPLPNSNTPNYQPGPINETTYFYRCVRRAGCVYLESNLVTITVGDDIDATIERPALGCFGETQTYSISGVAANATINWSFSGPVTVSGTSGSSVDVTFVGGGFLDVSVTITVDDCTGVFTDRVTINGNCLGGDDDTASSANTSSAITAYPNPTTDRALISFGETAATEVLLYNVNQQVIARYPVQADARNLAIDLRDQRQGLYFVQIINAQGEQQLLKLMKQ